MDTDVAIIGGGPAGSGLASYLAKSGIHCTVLEREIFPRPHVGESLVPSSTRVFRELGLLPVLDRAKFPRKYGAVWTSTESAVPFSHGWDGLEAAYHAPIRFAEREQPGVPESHTYHVDRGRFDQLLLEHSESLGAVVHQGTSVCNVEIGSDCAKVGYVRDGRRGSINARMVADASGRDTFLGRKLGLKRTDPVFDQFALHSWFEDLDRTAASKSAEYENFIFVHFLPISSTWVWQIPITDSITSIGVVTQKKNFKAANKSGRREDFFWKCVGSRPELHSALRKAKQVRPLRAEGDYSYAMTRICGDRWIMIGDAARFVDPIFSTGVSIALNSARFASRDVVKAVQLDDFSKERFATFEKTISLGMKNWYEFISLYYRLNVLFTAFINNPRYRLDLLKLIQGDVYDDPDPAVLRSMRSTVEAVERNPQHLWHGHLGELTSRSFHPEF